MASYNKIQTSDSATHRPSTERINGNVSAPPPHPSPSVTDHKKHHSTKNLCNEGTTSYELLGRIRACELRYRSGRRSPLGGKMITLNEKFHFLRLRDLKTLRQIKGNSVNDCNCL
jgi:hypothetical protein